MNNIPGLASVLINFIPVLLMLGVWAFFRFGLSGNQKRIAEALERIATALEKRH